MQAFLSLPGQRAALAQILALALLAGPEACAQPLTQERVAAQAAGVYAVRVAALDAAGKLDPAAAFTARVRRVAAGLIAQAARDYPDTAAWPWEVHATTDPDQDADSMAGGKILVSQAYVERLELSDVELAMLLAHEIAHVVLRHNLHELEQALALDPAWAGRPLEALVDAVDHDAALMARLAPLNVAQEMEADHAGLLLAAHAGWPPERLARYYHKMMRASGRPYLDSDDHPAPARRWQAARALAITLAAPVPVPMPVSALQR
ncbi:M48 family metalloprotease [Duganella sp. LX20W]|uniref:M48 family metalloprotease n=1 Tax=Rugamonas brunnea TaxID=2758569 RepID=A0A7W2IDU3_9BURK|nr:M48 family metalloprotease [Rugamonas brunnea]MBA5639779.1 M48 family metalloprotease [Rugamonas brunnea]